MSGDVCFELRVVSYIGKAREPWMGVKALDNFQPLISGQPIAINEIILMAVSVVRGMTSDQDTRSSALCSSCWESLQYGAR